MGSRRTLLAAAVAAATMAVSACASPDSGSGGASPSSGSAEQPMTIEAFQALSGPVAPAGEAMSIGNKAAVTVMNAAGGVLGKPLSINTTDSGGSADQIAAKLQEMLSKGRPQAVLPGSASEIPAAIPILSNAGVFTSHHFTGANFNDPAKYSTTFGNAHTIPAYVASVVAKARAAGYKKVGVVDSDDASGAAFEAVAKPAFEQAGIAATFVSVAPTAVDATPQLQQALAQNPDALLLAGYYAGARAVIAARTKLQVKIPTISIQTFSANNLDGIGQPKDYEGIQFQHLAVNVQGTPQTQSTAFKKFYDAVLKEAGGTLKFPINTYLVAYNDVILAAYAANLARSYDAKAMTKALEGATAADMPNYVMPAGFSATNHYPNVSPDDFVFVTYAPSKNGMVIAGTGR